MEQQELRDLMLSIVEMCKVSVRKDKMVAVLATIYARDGSGNSISMDCPLNINTTGDKDLAYRTFALAARSLNAEAVVIETTGWAAPAESGGKRPSEAADRVRVLAVSGAMKGFKHQMIVFFKEAGDDVEFENLIETSQFESMMTDAIWEESLSIARQAGFASADMLQNLNDMACSMVKDWKGPMGVIIGNPKGNSVMRLCRKPSESQMDRMDEFVRAVDEAKSLIAIMIVQKGVLHIPVIKNGKVDPKRFNQPVVIASILGVNAALTITTPFSETDEGPSFGQWMITKDVGERIKEALFGEK